MLVINTECNNMFCDTKMNTALGNISPQLTNATKKYLALVTQLVYWCSLMKCRVGGVGYSDLKEGIRTASYKVNILTRAHK